MSLVIKYILFASIATLFNIATQYVSLYIYSQDFSLYIAMALGTVVGLVCKYILDKKYIFYHKPKSTTDDGKKFLLYSLMGVLTTLIFWGCEIGFDAMFHSEKAKYAGAIVGLSIGYITKYMLDKKFVFVS